MIARVVSVLLGTVLGALCSYCAFWIVGWAFGPLYASEEDMSRNVKIFLACAAIFMVCGGWLGNWMFKLFKRRLEQ
ncbi:hypothetical protein ASE07_25145 [Noviherbaspirillum sp. Root189]|nr:hypothetical protein ASE07_25145 [Noviherbaspirillum sp. Root189]